MTIVLPAAAAAIEQAAELLRQGELVAFPTETVYGLGADATSSLATAKYLRRKRTPSRSIRSSLMSAVLRRRNARRGCRRRLSGSRAAFGQARSPLSRQPASRALSATWRGRVSRALRYGFPPIRPRGR